MEEAEEKLPAEEETAEECAEGSAALGQESEDGEELTGAFVPFDRVPGLTWDTLSQMTVEGWDFVSDVIGKVAALYIISRLHDAARFLLPI